MPAPKKQSAEACSELERRFATFYLEEFVASKAYLRASPRKVTVRTAEVNGSKLLKMPRVRALIKQERDKYMAKADLSIEQVLLQLKAHVLYDPRLIFDAKGKIRPMAEWPAEVAAAVVGVKDTLGGREIKFVDKGASLERAMKYFGLFREDNRQRTDPLAEMIAHIQSNGSRVQPKS